MVKGLLFRIGVLDRLACWEWALCIVESILKGGFSISSSGESRAGVAMDCWKYLLVDESVDAEAGEVTYDPDVPIFGNVCRRGRESALASVGRRGICEAMLGLGPQLDTGENIGDFGLLKSGENVVWAVVSVWQLAREMVL